MDSKVIFENTPKIAVDDLLHELEYNFTDAPHDLLAYCVLQSISRLCEQANVMRRTAEVRTYPNVHNYLLEPPDDVDVIAVMSICETHSKFITPRITRVNAPVCECRCSSGSTVHINRNELVFSNPMACTAYLVNMSVKPKPNACEVDASLLSDYLPTIIKGAQSILFSMVDKPWSSAQRGLQAEKDFMIDCAGAAVDTLMGRQRGAFVAKRQRAF